MTGRARTATIILIAVLVVVGLALLPSLGLKRYYVTLMTQVLILGIAAASLDLLAGVGNMVSFGHTIFFGIGAYTVAILATKAGVTGYFPTLLAAAGMAFAVALVTGLIALRATGVGFLIITLALNQVVWGLAFQWMALTGGENGIFGFSRGPIFGLKANGNVYYLFCLAMAVLLVGGLYFVYRSPFGLILSAIREQPRRVRALGYNVWTYRYIAFVVAGLIAGVAGGLFAFFNSYASPSDLALPLATELLIMVILGGTGTLFGPLVGAFILVFLSNLLSSVLARWMTVLGITYIIIIMFAPDGIVGIARRYLAPLVGKRATKGQDRLNP